MKTCPTCGKMSEDYVSVCDQCGTALPQLVADLQSGGLNFLSFICPVAGLIMFLSMKAHRPNRARGCGKWALIGAIVSVVINVVVGIIYGAAIGSMIGMGYYY